MTKDELAKRIAKAIFLSGEDGSLAPVHRIQFMHGNIHSERPGGGLGEGPLADVIRRVLVMATPISGEVKHD